MPRTYITLGLPRILHALHDIPGITRIWKTLDGEQYWIAVSNLQQENVIATRLGDAVDQATEQYDGANVVFLFNLVLPGMEHHPVLANAQVCWTAPSWGKT
jgi:hypothetical protein